MWNSWKINKSALRKRKYSKFYSLIEWNKQDLNFYFHKTKKVKYGHEGCHSTDFDFIVELKKIKIFLESGEKKKNSYSLMTFHLVLDWWRNVNFLSFAVCRLELSVFNINVYAFHPFSWKKATIEKESIERVNHISWNEESIWRGTKDVVVV